MGTPLDNSRPTQHEASSTDAEASAISEQPAADASSETPAASPDGTQTEQPKLTRAQRRALKQQSADTTAGDSTVDAQDDPDDDDVIARVERVDEKLARLEALMTPQTQPPPDVQEYANTYAETFGDDDEFARRAEIALRDRTALSIADENELSVWAANRKAANVTDVKWKRNLSTAALSTASTLGLDPASLLAAPTPAAIFSAFYDAGKSAGSSESGSTNSAREAELTARIEKLERTSRLVADENEVLQERAPAATRGPINGGLSGTTSNGSRLDPNTASSRDLIAAGLAKRRLSAARGAASQGRAR